MCQPVRELEFKKKKRKKDVEIREINKKNKVGISE